MTPAQFRQVEDLFHRGKDPTILYTLASAYSLAGVLAKAIETEEKAISLLPPGDSTLREPLEKSIARFRRAASQPTTTQPAGGGTATVP